MDPTMMQQAMNMMNSMSSEQRRQFREQAAQSDPDTLLRQAQAAKAQFGSKNEPSLAQSLKQEGNDLHRQKRYDEAAAKYEKGLHVDGISTDFSKSLHSNLASCYLQMGEWKKCLEQCNKVLLVESKNMKALYRRGQAYMGLDEYSNAVQDLALALNVAGPNDKAAIQNKLDEARSKSGDDTELVSRVTIEEVEDTVEEIKMVGVTDDGRTAKEETARQEEHHHTNIAYRTAPDQARMVKEMLGKDPNALKNAAKMMENMPPEALEAMMKNMPGAEGMNINIEQMKMAAKMMENMSPKDFERMSQMSQSFGMGGQQHVPSTGSGESSNQESAPQLPAQSMEEMRNMMQDPATLKNMRGMLKNMDPEVLSSMLKAQGVNISKDQVSQMVDQMGNLNDKQIYWISKIASVINFIINIYMKVKVFIRSQAGLVLALLVLLLAIYLRWKGII